MVEDIHSGQHINLEEPKGLNTIQVSLFWAAKDQIYNDKKWEGFPEDLKKDLLNNPQVIKELEHFYDWKCPILEEKILPVIDYKALMQIKTDVQNWLISDLIPSESVMVLAGKRGQKKTFMALGMAISLTRGISFLDKFAVPKTFGILYLDEENGNAVMQERLKKLNDGIDLENFFIASYLGIKLDKPEWYEQLTNFLKSHTNVKLLIIDSFRRVSGIEENDAGEISDFLTTKIRPLVTEFGITALLIHHVRKGLGRAASDPLDEIRGSSDIANYCDAVLIVEQRKDGSLILSQAKMRRQKEIEPFGIEMKESDGKIQFIYTGTAQDVLTDVDRCASQILVWLNEQRISEFETKDAISAMKSQRYGKKTVSRAIAELWGQKRLVKIKKGSYAKPTGTLKDFENSTGQEDADNYDVSETNLKPAGMCDYCHSKKAIKYDKEGNAVCQYCLKYAKWSDEIGK